MITAFEVGAALKLTTSGFSQSLSAAESKFKGFGGRMSGITKGIGKILGATFSVGAITKFVKNAVEEGKSFDAAMSQVAATMGKTTDEITELRDFARQMGATTAFTATQAAEALNYMALAGYDAKTSIGMLPNVLNLAAAGNFDLARASDMITDAQTAFGLSLERTSQMVDEMAKAASTGNTSVEQLGDAFLVVGGLAKELNGGFITLANGSQAQVDGIQELEIALTAMANAGIKGSEAGTHMRNMLMKLSNPTSKGTKMLEKMGVSVFDASGKMRSLSDIFGDLNDSFSTMTQEEKINAISELFNARDLSSAQALLAAISQDWDHIGDAILHSTGAANKMADTQLDNLAGDTTKFKSALGELYIVISDRLTPALRGFVQWGTRKITQLTNAFKKDGLSGAIKVVEEDFDNLVKKLKESDSPVLSFLGSSLETIKNGLNWIMENQELVIAAVTAIIGAFTISNLVAFAAKLNPVVLALELIAAAATLVITNWEQIKADWEKLWSDLGDMVQKVVDKLKKIWTGIPKKIEAAWGKVSGWFQENVTTPVGKFFDDAFSKIKQIWDGILGKITSAWETIAGWIQTNVTGPIESAFTAVNNVIASIIEGLGKIFGYGDKDINVNVKYNYDAPADEETFTNPVGNGSHILVPEFYGDDGSYNPHAKGAWNIPYDNYPAMLHRNEMVLTETQAREYRTGEAGGSADVVRAIHELRTALQSLQLVVGEKTFGRAVVNYSGRRLEGYIGQADSRLASGYGT